MKLLICLLATLVAAFARPQCENFYAQKKADVYIQMWNGFKYLKNPQIYEGIKEMSKFDEILPEFMALFQEFPEGDKANLEKMLQHHQNYKEILIGMYNLAKAVLVEGAKPTQEELTNLAKKMSAAVRVVETRFRFLSSSDIMPNATVDMLKRLVVDNPIKLEGNNFIELFKTNLPKIYLVARRLSENVKYIKGLINKVEVTEPTTEGSDEAQSFYGEFMLTELFELLKDEETAIHLYNNFGTFFDTLKNPASYDSLQALYDGFKRTDRLEAYAILIREAAKCLGQSMTPEEKAEFHTYVKRYLQLFKAIMADGQETSENTIMEFLCEPDEHSGLYFQNLAAKIGGALLQEESQEKIRKCLVSDADREEYRTALEMASVAPVFPRDTHFSIREHNEKVYAIVFLMNGCVKAVRKRQGLGPEADAYFKHAVTLRHVMLKFADFCKPSDAMKAEMESERKSCTEKFNSLSASAKEELVNMFPYRTVMFLSTLH